MKKLTDKQKRFCQEYLVDLNATQAAIRAGYTKKTARKQGSRLLENPDIHKVIEEGKRRRYDRTEVKLDDVVQQLARMLFIDPRKLVDDHGRPLRINDLPDEAALAIQGMKVVTFGNKDRGVGEALEYRFTDRNSAADKLMKHLGGYEVDNRQRGGEIADLLREIAGSTGVLDQAKERSENG